MASRTNILGLRAGVPVRPSLQPNHGFSNFQSQSRPPPPPSNLPEFNRPTGKRSYKSALTTTKPATKPAITTTTNPATNDLREPQTRLYVTNFPPQLTSDNVLELFDLDKNKTHCSATAPKLSLATNQYFAHIDLPESLAETVISYSNQKFGDYEIFVDYAKQKSKTNKFKIAPAPDVYQPAPTPPLLRFPDRNKVKTMRMALPGNVSWEDMWTGLSSAKYIPHNLFTKEEGGQEVAYITLDQPQFDKMLTEGLLQVNGKTLIVEPLTDSTIHVWIHEVPALSKWKAPAGMKSSGQNCRFSGQPDR